ncbi:protein of unknown function [Taphrina deformans PYCC 5710]|uniref:Uncharacterized protein n=1 Tax=Taphrina deformans (strain PYCC 5710 / ATCC 11124 / CBS 356.35 / IMI 108563 / JCM 9778 / NBRC 8474) TaxID=1097556 RepID=R4X6J7_TAPDE|nr:protein of unknown function [Taphrina deformans PYCC 5710]|eukprot:CCG80769.1 protein of unknown function [Taphrina deformans PYCC 5710]
MGLCASKPKVVETAASCSKRQQRPQRKPVLKGSNKLSPIPEVSSSETTEEVEIKTVEQKRQSVQLVRSEESFPMRRSSASIASVAEDAPILILESERTEPLGDEGPRRVPTPAPESPFFQAQSSEATDPFGDFDAETSVRGPSRSPFTGATTATNRAQYSAAYATTQDRWMVDARLDDIESQVDMLKYMHDRARQDLSRDLGQQRMDLDALMEVVHELCERDLIGTRSQDSGITVQRL